MAEQKITDEQVEKIINYLQGSCKTMEQAIHAITEDDDLIEDDLTDEQRTHIDQTIFLCTDCGWWCEISEEVKSEHEGELGCRECNPECDEDYEEED